MIRNTIITAIAVTLVSATAAMAEWRQGWSGNAVTVHNGKTTIVLGVASSTKEQRQLEREGRKLAKQLNQATEE